MRILRVFIFMIFIASFHSLSWALPIESCRGKNAEYQNALVSRLDELEKIYVRYRWLEAKIRQVYYEDLWTARLDGNDPLSYEKRESGQDLEKKYLEILKPFQRESEERSTGFVAMVEDMKNTNGQIGGLCERRDVHTCLLLEYKDYFEMMDRALKLFTRIFESEREYRVKVENASGGRDGLYPEDTLEPAGEHTDYYWRFEQSQSQDRFQQDAEMMRLLMDARKFLLLDDRGEGCCRQCV